jgi:hypothetical protein
MSRKRIFELLDLVAESAKDDRSAGRMIWAAQQEELVKLVRQMFSEAKKKQGEAWRKWYGSPKGKLAQQRKKERGALGPNKNDELGGALE